MTTTITPPSTSEQTSDQARDVTQTEAFARSADILERHLDRGLAELLAAHLLRNTPGGWEVQQVAVQAAARRAQIAERDELRPGRRPAGGWRGTWTTKRPRRKERPWRTALWSVDPLVAGCGCPDYRANSLGLCKHVLAALADVASRPRVFARARAEGDGLEAARLRWIPFKPLFGSGDWLDRLRLEGEPHLDGRRHASLRRRFTRLANGELGPRSAHGDDPAGRLRLLRALSEAGHGSGALLVDPAVPSWIADELPRLETAAGLRAVRKGLGRACQGLGRKLYPYQTEGVLRFLETGRLLLADDMGLGKTTQAAAAAHALHRAGKVRRGLLLVPATLKAQWKREWQACTDLPVQIVEGTPEERAAIWRRTRSGFLLMNYELLLRDDLEHARRWRPDLVVLDEAQRIKNWETRTAASVKRLDPPYRLVLTGTPFENRLLELDSILEWLDRTPLQPQWRIEPFHGTGAGVAHLDVLRQRLQPVLLRRRRTEILRQLPPRTDTRIDVPLTPAQAEEHAARDQPIAKLVHITERRPLTQAEFLKLMMLLNQQRIISNGIAQLEFDSVWPGLALARPEPALVAGLSMPKLDELRDLLEQLTTHQERKVVVFSQWRRALQLAAWACGPTLADAGVDWTFFTGKESGKRRSDNLVRFHDEPAVRVLFSTDAGSVGLNLQRAATCCVNFDLPWNPAVLEQRVGRIHRLGQEQPIDVYHLVGEGCIEERIAGLVGNKKALFSALFDGDTDEVRFDEAGGFLATVRKLAVSADDDLPADDAWPDEEPLREVATAGSRASPPADAAETASRDAPPAPATQDIARLVASLQVTPRADGGLRIEAPPESAQALAAAFRGFAHVLERAAR